MFAFRILGGVSLTGEEGPLSGRPVQPRRIALLALLASHPRHTLSREKLTGFLWPDSDAAQARHRLSESLYVLRKFLGMQALVSEGDQVRLDPDRVDCDVVSFRRDLEAEDLEGAVALYVGPFLDGFFLKDADEFHWWLDAERHGLANEYSRALEALATRADRDGAVLEAVEWWTRLTAHDPYNSRFVLKLMQSLARAGDPGNALHHGREHLGRLREELGAEPPSEILSYAERLQDGAAWTGPAGEAGGAAAAYQPSSVQDDVESVTEARAEPHEASAPIRRRPGKLWAAAVVVLGTLLAPGAVHSFLTRNPAPGRVADLVVVPPFENRTGDPELDEAAILAAFWVEEALQQVPGVRLVPSFFARRSAPGGADRETSGPARALDGSANARWAVRGAIRATGDSLEFRVEVIDLSSPRMEQQVVEVGPRDSAAGILDRVARRVSGALAYEFDPMMNEWEGGGQPLPYPPTIEAFREHRLGYQAFDRGDFAEAYRHHMAAYALDTTLVRAAVAAAFATGDYQLKDSLARFATERRHLLSRRGQLDLDILSALLTRDHEGALRAIRELARLEGNGLNSVLEAWFAMRVNLPGEGLAATERYDPDLEWRRAESHYYWRYRAEALHMLGRFQDELTEACTGRQRFPSRLDLLIAEVRALAALGRGEEISDRLHEARSLPSYHDSVAVVAAVELRAHGYIAASKEAFSRATGWLEEGVRENGDDTWNRLYLARALYGLEQWHAANAVAEALLADQPDNVLALRLLGLTYARLGDSIAVGEAVDRLSGMAQPFGAGDHLYQMASIAAVLGRHDEAMRLLYQAFREGLPHGLRLHQDMDLESLRTREDFQALVTPRG